MNQICSGSETIFSYSLWAVLGRSRWAVLFGIWVAFFASSAVYAQGPSPGNTKAPPVVKGSVNNSADSSVATSAIQPAGHRDLDVFALLLKGGWFMVPLAITSVLVVTIGIERWIGLRNGRLMPRGLVKATVRHIRESDALDPKIAFSLCQKHPSALSNIMRTMLLKTGRPQAEIEQSVRESTQREADQAYHNVRWIGLASGVAPLLGLLGTVFGLIRAFHDTTQLGAGHSRAEYLAQGIYEAMVTTLTGLLVAIPAAILAHYFESKIAAAFRRIEDFMSSLLPLVEKHEGRARYEILGRELVERELQPAEGPSAAMANNSSGYRSSAIHGTVVAPSSEAIRTRRAPERT